MKEALLLLTLLTGPSVLGLIYLGVKSLFAGGE